MAKIYAKYDLKEIMKVKEEFLNEEVYDVVKKYYEEFSRTYNHTYECSKIIDTKKNIEVGLFEYVNDVLSLKLNLQVNIRNYFERLHNSAVFHNQTDNFGINSLERTPAKFHRIFRPNPFVTPSIFTFYPDKVNVVLHDLLKTEHFKKHLELTIKYELKKHFIRGRISNQWLALDLINRHGYKYIRRYYSIPSFYHKLEERTPEKVDKEFQKDLLFVQMHSRYNTTDKIYCNNLDSNLYLVDLHGELEKHQHPYGYEIGMLVRVDVEIMDIIQDAKMIDEYLSCEKGVENEFRTYFGLPNHGEGWVNETKLFHLIKNYFPEHLVIQHAKTPWLKKQHLDIYFPFLNIAIEYHGKQHFEPVEYFGGHEAFLKNQERDKRKKDLCEKYHCYLIEVTEKYDFDQLKMEINEVVKDRERQ